MSISRALLALIVLLLGMNVVRGGDPPAGPATQPVDFRKLKEALPAQMGGINRSEATGEKTAMGEMKISTARGSFNGTGDNAPQITVEIIDYGATKGMVDAMTAWTNVEMDRESDEGYEKTTKVGEWHAMETFHNDGKNGTLQLFVAGRFIVSVTSNNLPVEKFQKLGEELHLEKLAALK